MWTKCSNRTMNMMFLCWTQYKKKMKINLVSQLVKWIESFCLFSCADSLLGSIKMIVGLKINFILFTRPSHVPQSSRHTLKRAGFMTLCFLRACCFFECFARVSPSALVNHFVRKSSKKISCYKLFNFIVKCETCLVLMCQAGVLWTL